MENSPPPADKVAREAELFGWLWKWKDTEFFHEASIEFSEIALVGRWPDTRIRLSWTRVGSPRQHEMSIWDEHGEAPWDAETDALDLTQAIREGAVGRS
jgi:hypothetical protein